MQGTGHTVLVTGSNMSGKSTFLRTVGLNLVLAQMGAVVSAQSFTCSPARVFSSMRTQDSLEESTSSFYAELKRLRKLLELADENAEAPVFYLLDEILKGTNSADRHRGAEALIRQLHTKKASGMVSTHDLELGEWGATENYVHNFHFRSDVENGKLDFDYRLHEGICRSFNASELMRMMGIDIDLTGKSPLA
jgi:DNA mismatch repair ATPase MutS